MKIKKDAGFTLIELLIGMLITVTLMTVIFQVLTLSIKTYQYNMAIVHNKTIIRSALNQITDELRYAQAITNPAFVENQTTPKPPKTIEYKNDGKTCSISLDKSTKTILITNNTQTEIAKDMVTELSFARSGTLVNEVIISITVNDNSYIGSPSTTLDTIVIISNL